MNKNIIILGIAMVVVILSAWSPWITKDYAEKIVLESFISEQEGITDGCGFNCDGCGVIGSSNTLFGDIVKIGYSCGFKPYPGSPSPSHVDKLFVSFLGTIHTFSRATFNY